MTVLTRAFLLGSLILLIIAITFSALADIAICDFFASRLVLSETSSYYTIVGHAVHRYLCAENFIPEKRDDWNLFYHLGGNGPWIPKVNAEFGTYDKDGKPPEGCVVDQVHMLSRHAETYPTRQAGERMETLSVFKKTNPHPLISQTGHLSLLSRLSPLTLNGSLSFLNNQNWTYFTSTPGPSSRPPTFEDLTTTSSHAGTLSAFTLGTTLRTRYSHLLPSPPHPHPLTIWSTSSPPTLTTAHHFASALLGPTWSDPNSTTPAHLHIIPSTPSLAGNTLTPRSTCPRYLSSPIHGHAKGARALAAWQAHFTPPISARLGAPNPGLDPPLSSVEIDAMMELCGAEVMVRGPGSSPWCEVFSRDEWEEFEYGRDLWHFYGAGPGNRFAGVMGGLWLDATARLLVREEEEGGGDGGMTTKGEIYASFVHDGELVSVLAALGVLDEEGEQELPTDHVKRDRRWRTSDVVPMAGRLVIERLKCKTPHGWRYRDVRLFINDGWVGWAVPAGKEKGRKRVFVPQMDVKRFGEMVRERKEKAGRFGEVCGLEEGVEEEIGFLQQ